MPCSCGKSAGPTRSWVVTYPDGTKQAKPSPVAAQIAASKVAGATWAEVSVGGH